MPPPDSVLLRQAIPALSTIDPTGWFAAKPARMGNRALVAVGASGPHRACRNGY
jgi:hypothetical protein